MKNYNNFKDSVDYDYDFDQVMYAVYEGEYDGELGQFDLPRFEKTEELIQKLWDEKYNDIDDWREIPWTKEEKDQIFESGRNEAKMLDRMDIYNSRARYQSYDETRRVLKEIFGIDNKYLHDPKYDSNSNNKKRKGNKIRKFFYKCTVNNVYYISENPNTIKNICNKNKNIFVIEKVNNKFIDMKNGKSYLDKNIIGDKDSAIEYYNLIKNKKETKLMDSKTMKKINFKDTSADEIIDLINKAADEGRTYTWLQNRIPELDMHNKHYKSIFPTNYSNNTVYLTKPIQPMDKNKDKIMEMLPTLNKLLDEIHMILDKYPEQTDKYGLNQDKMDKLKDETDSKSESYEIEDDLNTYNKNIARIKNLLREYFYILPEDIIKIDKFTFNVLKDLYNKKDSFSMYKNHYKGNAIDLGERNKVQHLTKEQEDYIRKVIANSKRDITEWIKIRNERNEGRYNNGSYENDPINISRKARSDLKILLSQLKDLTNEKLPYDINYDVKNIISKLSNNWSITANDVYSAIEDLQHVMSDLPDYDEKINAKKEEIQKFMSDYKEKLKTLYAKKPLPDSISKKRSHKRDAFVSAFADKRVKDWRQVLHIYLEWEGILGYDDIIISYLENDEYDELREFLNDEGIYGYYYTIVDIFETGEVNIPDMDEEDYERFFN